MDALLKGEGLSEVESRVPCVDARVCSAAAN